MAVLTSVSFVWNGGKEAKYMGIDILHAAKQYCHPHGCSVFLYETKDIVKSRGKISNRIETRYDTSIQIHRWFPRSNNW